MDEEILFRGKKIDKTGWAFGFAYIYPYAVKKYKRGDDLIKPHYILEHDEHGSDVVYFNRGPRFREVFPETLSRYTGVDDSYGKKIFEGDIVKTYHHWNFLNCCYVKYQSGCFWLEKIYGSGIDGIDTLSEYKIELGTEVVGNIYDNPDIFNQAEKDEW